MSSERAAQAWVVRAGRKGETVEHNLLNEVVTYEWDQLPDLRRYANKQELKDDIDVLTPGFDGNARKIGNHAVQLWRFRTEIKPGDVVVLPLKRPRDNQHIAIGCVTGPYQFDASRGPGTRHRIPVEWLNDNVDISDLDRDLLEKFRTFRPTVGKIGEANAAERLLRIARPEVHLKHVWQDLHRQTSSLSGDEAGVQDLGGLAVPEGAITRAEVLRYERSASARAACLQHFGYRCQVCDLNFEERYGELGRGYMHVHHIIPLHEVAGTPEYQVDGVKDLRPVCPNCHAMLHRPMDRTLTVDELRELLLPRESSNG